MTPLHGYTNKTSEVPIK